MSVKDADKDKLDAESRIIDLAVSNKQNIPEEVKKYIQYFIREELKRIRSISLKAGRQIDGTYVERELKLCIAKIQWHLKNLGI